MADFCKQCMPGSMDFDRNQDMIVSADSKFPALCEGCGWTITDKDGNCLHCLMTERIKNEPKEAVI